VWVRRACEGVAVLQVLLLSPMHNCLRGQDSVRTVRDQHEKSLGICSSRRIHERWHLHVSQPI
jgi:hypothetical protein